MADGVLERLTQLEDAIRRAGETMAKLREENDRLKRDARRLEDERKQVLTQVDAILKDIAKLDLEQAP
jgi:FtsZ-binding cell division protein ZapB